MSEHAINLITMPKWGLAMQEGIVVDWHVKVGDRIAMGQPLCDIETTKITNEFEAPYAGVVARILLVPGATARVGELICVISDDGASSHDIDEKVATMLTAAQTSGDNGIETGPIIHAVETADGVIAYVQTGDASSTEAVLFLHGFGGDRKNWELLQSELPENIRAIAIDLPGHGASHHQVGNGSAKGMAKAVGTVIKDLGLTQVDLVAHSFGAKVAASVAMANAEKVRSLFVIAPLALGAAANAEYVNGYLRAERKRDLKPVMEMLFSSPGFVSRAIVNDALAGLRDESRRSGLDAVGKALLASPAGDVQQELAFLRRWPSMIVWGDQDRVVKMPEGLGDLAGDMLRVVPGTGHMPHAEKSVVVGQLLREHLDRANG